MNRTDTFTSELTGVDLSEQALYRTEFTSASIQFLTTDLRNALEDMRTAERHMDASLLLIERHAVQQRKAAKDGQMCHSYFNGYVVDFDRYQTDLLAAVQRARVAHYRLKELAAEQVAAR